MTVSMGGQPGIRHSTCETDTTTSSGRAKRLRVHASMRSTSSRRAPPCLRNADPSTRQSLGLHARFLHDLLPVARIGADALAQLLRRARRHVDPEGRVLLLSG